MDNTTNRILRLEDVMDRTGLTRATLYAAMKRGEFPKSIRIAARCVGWLEADIEAWIKGKLLREV